MNAHEKDAELARLRAEVEKIEQACEDSQAAQLRLLMRVHSAEAEVERLRELGMAETAAKLTAQADLEDAEARVRELEGALTRVLRAHTALLKIENLNDEAVDAEWVASLDDARTLTPACGTCGGRGWHANLGECIPCPACRKGGAK